jgi:hypothetical protein
MAEKPILFTTPMVQAILDGRKTMTRRVVKAPVLYEVSESPSKISRKGDKWEFRWNGKVTIGGFDIKPPYQPGDRLYVRETWLEYNGTYAYKADNRHLRLEELGIHFKWRPSIHMPKSAARIWITVTDVRVERVQEISEEDAKAEGCGHECGCNRIMCEHCMNTGYDYPPLLDFMELWDSLNAKRGYGWEQNPWVFVYTFEREG